jgi:hypothetical protein
MNAAINRAWLVRCFNLTLLCTLVLSGQSRESDPKRTFIHERDVQMYTVWHEPPRWDAQLLVGYDGNFSRGPVIFTLDRDGKRDDTLFTFDNAAGIRISTFGAVASSSGELAVIGSAYTSAPFTTYIARIAPDRKSQIITRVWPYSPTVVTFAPDGTLWTVGYLSDEDNTREIAVSVLRRFDASGKLLGSINVRARGRAYAGYLRASRSHIEFSLDGSERARYEGPPGRYEGSPGDDRYEITGVALSDANEVVATRFSVKQRKGVQDKLEILLLDRNTRKWIPVGLSSGMPEWAQALGFDGTTLVLSSRNGELSRFATK